ncbi:MAG: F0F1 ATP synthase subunit A [Puniceicoccales bacterium]|nr:F0F1 ATP synthase subunit A [Puniceicoccales bacterium]
MGPVVVRFFQKNWFWPVLCMLAIVLWRILPVATDAVDRAAHVLFFLFPHVPVSNAMVTGWILSLATIFGVRKIVGRKPTVVPTRGQALVEIFVEKMQALFEPIVGQRTLPHVLPLLLVLFSFILLQNWCGLLPGIGSIGLRNADGQWHHLLRPTNADLNATLGLALAATVGWAYTVLRHAGPRVFLHDTFGNRADRDELPFPLYLAMGIVFIGVGLVDLVSMLFRVVSLSFRLYGNVFGGESLIARMLALFGYLVPVPFYFLELLIGLIQALVFTLLTAVYVGLLTNQHGGGDR